tara:strand:+ start:2651 stop:5041 length:2391 start_codon:yes stop_codon:yes gene_type:complete
MVDETSYESPLKDIEDAERASMDMSDVGDGLATQSELDEAFGPDYDAEVEKEIKLREEFGDNTAALRNFAERTMASASLGLSDKALVAMGVPKEDLLNRKRLNPKTTIGGNITGVAAPLLLSGGSSALAQGARIGGAGVVASARAGLALENLTAKGLQKILGDKLKKKAVVNVLSKGVSKGAGSALEASLYTTGQLISEDALGEKEFNAENFLASAKEGALWGGITGAGFGMAPSLIRGGVDIVVPRIKNNRIVGFMSKKVDDFKEGYFNNNRNAAKMSGLNDVQIDDLANSKPEIFENISPFIKKTAKEEGLGILSSKLTLKRAVESSKSKSLKNIGKTLNAIDKVDDGSMIMPTRSSVAIRQDQMLDDLLKNQVDEFGEPLIGRQKDYELIDKYQKEISKRFGDDTAYTARGIYSDKVKYDNKINFDKGQWTLKDEIEKRMGDAVREEVYEMAANSGELGKRLRQEMLDYSTAATALKGLKKQAVKKDWGFFRDLFWGGLGGSVIDMAGLGMTGAAIKAFARSDLYNRFRVLSGIESANLSVNKEIMKSAKGFFGKTGWKTAITPVSNRIVLNSPLAQKDDQKPKNIEQAMNNISSKIDEIKADPSNLEKLTGNEALRVAAPTTYGQMKTVAGRALAFLDSKLPRLMNVNPLLRKKYVPATQEIYKFKKYLQAIQDPMAVLKQFGKGNISRESVEAIRFVYPDIYARLRVEIMKDIHANPEAVDYKQRLLLGILMDAPTDLALMPDSIKSLQQFYSEAAVSKAGGKISANAAKGIDKANSAATQLEKLQNPDRF